MSLEATASYPYCIATVVTHKAIEALLEASGRGNYRDEHPWVVARELLEDARAQGQRMALMLASRDEGVQTASFTHWTWINDIEVVELHRGQWACRCHLDALWPVNPIWEPVDSLLLKASAEQMRRENVEGLRVSRQSLDEHHIHPYAICETPGFITAAQPGSAQTE